MVHWTNGKIYKPVYTRSRLPLIKFLAGKTGNFFIVGIV